MKKLQQYEQNAFAFLNNKHYYKKVIRSGVTNVQKSSRMFFQRAHVFINFVFVQCDGIDDGKSRARI